MTICSIPSSSNCEGNKLVGVPNHLNWLIFSKNPMMDSNFPKVVTYVNIRLLSLYFSLWKDILNHRDILLISFFNNNDLFSLMNVYSDSFQLALKYFKDIEVNIQIFLVMTGNFDIRDNLWNPLYPHHSSLSDNLFIIADCLHFFFDTLVLFHIVLPFHFYLGPFRKIYIQCCIESHDIMLLLTISKKIRK